MKRVITEEYENGQLKSRRIEEDGELKQYWAPIYWVCSCPSYCALHPYTWWQQPRWYSAGGTVTTSGTASAVQTNADYIKQQYGAGVSS